MDYLHHLCLYTTFTYFYTSGCHINCETFPFEKFLFLYQTWNLKQPLDHLTFNGCSKIKEIVIQSKEQKHKNPIVKFRMYVGQTTYS